MTTRETVDRFVDALGRLESDGDVDGIVECFTEDCDIANVMTDKSFVGRRGARAFWTQYRKMFQDAQSTFHSKVVTDGRGVLEWHTEGRNRLGEPISYDGVSLIDDDGGRIKRFRAYFDSRALRLHR